MRLTKNQIDMLYRVALAKYFTSPSEAASYDSMPVLKQLEKAQLVRFDTVKRWCLTDDGNDMLMSSLDRERATLLRRVRERKAGKVLTRFS